jgi:hypothetical protein
MLSVFLTQRGGLFLPPAKVMITGLQLSGGTEMASCGGKVALRPCHRAQVEVSRREPRIDLDHLPVTPARPAELIALVVQRSKEVYRLE